MAAKKSPSKKKTVTKAAAKKKVAKKSSSKKKVAKKKVAKKKVATKAPVKKAPVKKAPAKKAAKTVAKKTEAPKKETKKVVTPQAPDPKPKSAPKGKFLAAGVNLGHVFTLRPRLETSFRQADFRTAKLHLQDEGYETLEEAVRAVAEKALELTLGGAATNTKGKRR